MNGREARDGKRPRDCCSVAPSLLDLRTTPLAAAPQFGIPMRYAIIAAPSLCCDYYVWLKFGPPKVRNRCRRACDADVRAIPVNGKASHDRGIGTIGR